MNTEAIKAYANAKAQAKPEIDDEWYRFDDNWDINIFWDNAFAHFSVFVYPVIDKQVQTDFGFVYKFVVEV